MDASQDGARRLAYCKMCGALLGPSGRARVSGLPETCVDCVRSGRRRRRRARDSGQIPSAKLRKALDQAHGQDTIPEA